MLERIFLQVINMSYIASIVILFILVTRLLLAKAPKKYSYILWAVALVRLIVPISFESVLSLVPVDPKPISNDVLYDISPNINTGVSNIDHSISGSLPAADVVASVNPMQVWIFIGSLLWLLGIATLVIYGMVSLIRMRVKLKNANCEKDNIYQSDKVTTPFVLGLIQPKIYLPASLSESEKEYILLHEQTHIKRFDHIIRFISYIVLCIHWFNPLVWIAFWLSGKDMEMSCDELVISKLGQYVKKDYSQSLLNLATGRRNFGLTPLAFGEGDTKGRIKNILNFKQPKFYIIIIALVILIFTSIGLLSNPKSEEAAPPPPASAIEGTDYVSEEDETILTILKEINPESNLLLFDQVEWITLEDVDRIDAIGIDPNNDMPSGFYVHNASEDIYRIETADQVTVFLLNWEDLTNYIETDLSGLAERMDEYDSLYHLTIEDGLVTMITEQYTP